MSNSRNPNIVPTFLQPNTVRSSRAAIFDDDFDQHQHQQQLKPKHSNRPKFSRRHQDQDSQEEDSENGDDQQSKSILERLYGQLQSAIEIEETTAPTAGVGLKQRLDDDSDKSEAEEEGQGEDDGMEFRLFASDDTPTTIVLNSKEPEIIYVHRERPPLDESPGSERMRQIVEAAIDAKTVLEQSHIPWERSFFLHKVIHVPFKQETGLKKVKKSKRKREWEKKIKAGLIDQATIDITARKTKVCESWSQPYIQRHGLDRNTIVSGTQPRENYSSRGGRGGGRSASRGGARGGRGGGRGRGRGGAAAASTGMTCEGHAEKADRNGDNEKKEVSTDRPAKKKSIADSTIKKTQGEKVKPKSELTSTTTTTTTTITTKTTADATLSTPTKKRIADSGPSDKPESSINNSSATPAAAPPPRLPKKPKANKPMTKLDNIMAILTGK
ncbi:hypothetical protein BG015_009655 [Linnemannia schmuckeri]|uniref:Uncharacterized protein n=1 Tax=Linnemannia schmuckeri TaxID=64567 RepID=A0A9P5RXB1_9FUNG|nr:hypothetical protein BG015_009655 [Linnemannia schmuckeri]